MKKIKTILVVIVVVGALTGCSKLNDVSEIGDMEIHYTPKMFQGIKVIKEKNDELGYSIYSYKGNVEICIDGKMISLQQAIDTDEVTIEDILNKAIEDRKSGMAQGDAYKDGGSQLYKYSNYAIIKYNSLDGKQDVYIGNAGMDINDL